MDALQLDQLHLAVRSPDRTAVKGHDGATPSAIKVQIEGFPPLIRQANVREHLADLRTSRSVFDVCAHFTANRGPVDRIPRTIARRGRPARGGTRAIPQGPSVPRYSRTTVRKCVPRRHMSR